MDQPFLLAIVVVLIGFCLAAFFITIEALFGELVEGITRSAEEKPGRAFWVGLGNTVFLIAIAIGLMSLAEISVWGIVPAVPGFSIGIFVAVGIVWPRRDGAFDRRSGIPGKRGVEDASIWCWSGNPGLLGSLYWLVRSFPLSRFTWIWSFHPSSHGALPCEPDEEAGGVTSLI